MLKGVRENNIISVERIFLMKQKKQKIDKTHWIIQSLTLIIISLLFLFLPRVLDLKYLFPREITEEFFLIPSFLLIFSSLLAIFFRKNSKPFTRLWIFSDFTYWNIFAFLLSWVAIFHFLTQPLVYGVFTQIFGYVALLLGYANELRNEIIGERVKKK